MGYPLLFIAILSMSILLMFGTPSSLNPDKLRQEGDLTRFVTTLNAVALEISTYEISNKRRVNPNTWYDQLKSDDAIVPRSTSNRVWSMGENVSGRYICATLPMKPSKYQIQLYSRVQQMLDRESFVGEECGALTNSDQDEIVSSISISMYVGN